jgi:hypothetical protein
LLPGLPGIPAPEFCPLGTVTWPPPGRSVVCAEAGSVTIASAIAPITNLNMANSLLYDKKADACRLHTVPQKRFRGPLRSSTAASQLTAAIFVLQSVEACLKILRTLPRADALSWPDRNQTRLRSRIRTNLRNTSSTNTSSMKPTLVRRMPVSTRKRNPSCPTWARGCAPANLDHKS